jgi:xanthine dehydrogenase molybdenum-binding subunit
MLNAVGIWTEPPVLDWAWHTQGLWGMALETGRPRMRRQANFMEVDTETGEVFVTRVVNVNEGIGKVVVFESA